jgi:hypothetical protein
MNPKRLTRREALKIGAGLIIGTSIKIAAADSTLTGLTILDHLR